MPSREQQPHRCDALEIVSYELDEVVAPPSPRQRARPVVRIVIRGRNLRHRAVPLVAWVGDVPVSELRLDEGAQTLEGILLAKPKRGSRVRIAYLDMDSAEHPTPYSPARVDRIPT